MRDGQHDGQARMNTQAFDVADRIETPNQLTQRGVGQHQRIAAGQYDFGYLRILSQGRKCCFAPIGAVLLVREVFAKAVAAVDGARRGRDQERAASILLNHRGRARKVLLSQRIHAESRAVRQHVYGIAFRRRRQYLSQQRIVGVVPTHPRDERPRNAQRKPGTRIVDLFVQGEPQHPAKFRHGCDGFFQLATPDVRLPGSGIGGNHMDGHSKSGEQF